MKTNILIVGFGVVGENIYNRLDYESADIFVTDKNKDVPSWANIEDAEDDTKVDLMFICVPTPYTYDNPCDTSIVKAAIEENLKYLKEDGVIVIKSTVLPGTTNNILSEFLTPVIFSPEYYGGTKHNDRFNNHFDFTILGGIREDCNKAVQVLQKFVKPEHKFIFTNATTAELVKYMENSWLATKVSFCSQFYQIAEQVGVSYPELRELFLLDPRVNPSHTFIFEDHPYWDSHCLNKDVPAIAETYNAEFLLDMIAFNKKVKGWYEDA